MKFNYKIYENYSGEMPEDNTQFTEQKILAQVKQQLEESKRIVVRPKVKVWKDALLLFGVAVLIAAVLITLRLFTDISNVVFALICVAVPEDDMLYILKHLDSSKNPIIIIE